MGILKRIMQGVDIALDTESMPTDGWPVELGPGTSPLDEIAALARYADQARAVHAASPTAVKARIVQVTERERIAATPVATVQVAGDGFEVEATIPVTGTVRRASPGDGVEVHVVPGDPSSLALAAGAPGRAIVQMTEGVPDTEGTKALIQLQGMNMVVRPRHADGGFGDGSLESPVLPREACLLMTEGTEIPVILDHVTGAVRGIDVEALIDEFEPRFAEARAAEKERSKRGLGFVTSAIREGIADLREPDAPSETLEGATVEQWLQVREAIAINNLKPARHQAIARSFGVPEGAWDAADAAWSARAETDPELGARLAKAARPRR